MMADQDSGDYELMPEKELEDLRRQVSSLKKNSMTEGDKARILIESMDRLTISINRLITILDDAQKDIIEEYQQSKPAEKLNQILEQNETIAKAMVAMHENITSDPLTRSAPLPVQQQPQQPQFTSQQNPPSQPQFTPPPNLPIGSGQKNIPLRNDNYRSQQNTKQNIADNPYSMMTPSMPPLDDFNTIDNLPPLDNPIPNAPKKKFLGIM